MVTPVLYRFYRHLRTTQPQPLRGAGWVAALELPAWPDLRGVHPPMGKGDKCLLQVRDSHSREEKKKSHHACWCITFYGIACHILLLIYEHPHHITSTKQDIFTSLYPTQITLWLKYALTP